MIINRIRADNVLKYAHLELDDVPEKGLIAVIGDNESGKSSIGESICFALFGRTFSLAPDELNKVIRWGESRCSIRLDFTTPDGERYQIARFLDELGNHGASIGKAGEDPMIRGIDETAAALKDIIGFGYTELIESFYLAQREITTPHPHSSAVRAMAGVDALEKVATACREEIGHARKQIEKALIQRSDVETRIAALGFDESCLARLKGEHVERARALESDRRKIGTLKTVCEHNETALAAMKDTAESWLSVSGDASLRERRVQAGNLAGSISGLEPQYGRDEVTAKPFSALSEFSRDSRLRLDAFAKLFDAADAYRLQLAFLLGKGATGGASDTGQKQTQTGDQDEDDKSASVVQVTDAIGDTERPFAERRANLQVQKAQALSSRNRARLGAILFLLPALAASGLWGLLGLLSHDPQVQALSNWLSALHPGWETALLPWLPSVAALLGVAALASVARSATLSARLRTLGEQTGQLAEAETAAEDDYARLVDLDGSPLPHACSGLRDLGDDKLCRLAAAIERGPGLDLLDREANAAYRSAFRQLMQHLEKGISSIKAGAGREIERLHEAVTEQTGAVAHLAGVIERENDRMRRHVELLGIATALQARIDEMTHRIRVRDLAIDLLDGAIHYISQRFNTEIRNLAADSLPKFTNGRYEHLQIDENLKVKAFSNEKRNFMELDEISSGTQRQIMLAVRLALSQKLVNSVIQGPQMVFLDEPFAFFDEGRTASSLSVLPQVSGDFTQIWVTSQTFPARSRFDLYIECSAAQSQSPRVWRDGDEPRP